MDIVLYSPDIPQNTGNIGRTCVATHAKLILVRPLGFNLSDRLFKRAGLDYFEHLEWEVIDSLEPILERKDLFFFSSHAKQSYSSVSYSPEATLVFGSETKGLPQIIFENFPDRLVTIPMNEKARCLNLSNSVAIGAYEVLRQNPSLLKKECLKIS